MIKVILAILLLCATASMQSEQAKASGAVVVFLQVRTQEYKMTSAIRDKAFNSSALFNYLESSRDDIYVARIDPLIYRMVSAYGYYKYDVSLNFIDRQKITFHYYSSLKAFIGFTDAKETVVLLPLNSYDRFDRDATISPLEEDDLLTTP